MDDEQKSKLHRELIGALSRLPHLIPTRTSIEEIRDYCFPDWPRSKLVEALEDLERKGILRKDRRGVTINLNSQTFPRQDLFRRPRGLSAFAEQQNWQITNLVDPESAVRAFRREETEFRQGSDSWTRSRGVWQQLADESGADKYYALRRVRGFRSATTNVLADKHPWTFTVSEVLYLPVADSQPWSSVTEAILKKFRRSRTLPASGSDEPLPDFGNELSIHRIISDQLGSRPIGSDAVAHVENASDDAEDAFRRAGSASDAPQRLCVVFSGTIMTQFQHRVVPVAAYEEWWDAKYAALAGSTEFTPHKLQEALDAVAPE